MVATIAFGLLRLLAAHKFVDVRWLLGCYYLDQSVMSSTESTSDELNRDMVTMTTGDTNSSSSSSAATQAMSIIQASSNSAQIVDFGTTPGGTFFGTTPGGMRLSCSGYVKVIHPNRIDDDDDEIACALKNQRDSFVYRTKT